MANLCVCMGKGEVPYPFNLFFSDGTVLSACSGLRSSMLLNNLKISGSRSKS